MTTPPIGAGMFGKAHLVGQQRSQPVLHRLDDGMAYRMDRTSAGGNGLVPMAEARAWEWLREELLANG